MDIMDFLKITGASAELRDDCINYPNAYIVLIKGRYIQSLKDAESLLTKINDIYHGTTPSAAWDRWNQYIKDQGTHKPDINRNSPHIGSSTVTNKSGPKNDFPKEISDCVAGLLAIVAEQQHKIFSLKKQVQALGLLHIQSQLGNQASTHLTNALHNTLDRLDQSRHQMASVEVGTVVHKGRLSIESSSDLEEETNSHREDKQSSSTEVDVNLEISGLMKLLAGAKLGVDVNLEKVQERLDEMSRASKEAISEKLEGEYEVSYEGVKVVVGK